ncbi:MAG TPA: NAD(P)-dependent oxidoreductase [Candidatus Dormibacteraeota bacterium]|nr:NAD(P)-dependent oxidoreductase [Candidatus Dormibacteraeota bacterium]
MRVAILGTGKMGGAMARRLSSQGHELTLWNRTRERAEALGIGSVTATPAEAVENVDVVISILTDANAVRAAYLGEGGAAKAAKSQVFVEMSTAGPDVSVEIAPHIERAGAQYVEAPVLGTIPAVEGGTLVVLAAGDEAAIERARPVLQALGEVRRVGALGSAAKLKLVSNTMIAGVTALAAELLAAGTTAGLNVEDIFAMLSRVAPYLNTRKAGLVEHHYEPVTFALRDAVKDLRLANELYKRTGATTPLAAATKERYEQAAKSAGDLDMSAIATIYEKQPARRDSV